ncbi:MAG: hypothetical protein JNK67_00020 [Alphaproteobacteria bacterium]|nr:hypothetical protein [Alphaproteobacteria bacterium]
MLGKLLGLFARDPLDRAARRYAETLPGQLARDYGASDRYSPDQVRLSAQRAKLPAEFLAVGYAAYLDRDAFAAALPARAAEYDALRALFLKHEDLGLQSGKGADNEDE